MSILYVTYFQYITNTLVEINEIRSVVSVLRDPEELANLLHLQDTTGDNKWFEVYWQNVQEPGTNFG